MQVTDQETNGTNPLQVISPLRDSVTFSNLYLEKIVVSHECSQLSSALPTAASNTCKVMTQRRLDKFKM